MLKQRLDDGFHLSSGELLIYGSQMRDQLIGVMPNFIQLVTVFVIAGMCGLHLPYLLIQLLFQFQIIFFCTFHVSVLTGIRRSDKGTARSMDRC